MNREKFKKEFNRELLFFSMITSRDLEKGFTVTQVEDELIKFASSFYGARVDFDIFALRKAYFVSTYAYQIIKYNIEDIMLNELCDDIEEEHRVRAR